MTTEYRVVWCWKGRDYDTKEKVRIYKTEKGARARFERLKSNDGRFVHVNDDGYGVWNEVYELKYVRLEIREVEPWAAQEEWNAP